MSTDLSFTQRSNLAIGAKLFPSMFTTRQWETKMTRCR